VRLLRQLWKTGQPIVVTINDQTPLIVEDEVAFEKLIDLVDRLETLEILREGIVAADRGEGRPAAEVFAEIRRKHGLPPEP
jgi:hypothetical protein